MTKKLNFIIFFNLFLPCYFFSALILLKAGKDSFLSIKSFLNDPINIGSFGDNSFKVILEEDSRKIDSKIKNNNSKSSTSIVVPKNSKFINNYKNYGENIKKLIDENKDINFDFLKLQEKYLTNIHTEPNSDRNFLEELKLNINYDPKQNFTIAEKTPLKKNDIETFNGTPSTDNSNKPDSENLKKSFNRKEYKEFYYGMNNLLINKREEEIKAKAKKKLNEYKKNLDLLFSKHEKEKDIFYTEIEIILNSINFENYEENNSKIFLVRKKINDLTDKTFKKANSYCNELEIYLKNLSDQKKFTPKLKKNNVIEPPFVLFGEDEEPYKEEYLF